MRLADYTAILKPIVKVLDFVQCGGPSKTECELFAGRSLYKVREPVRRALGQTPTSLRATGLEEDADSAARSCDFLKSPSWRAELRVGRL